MRRSKRHARWRRSDSRRQTVALGTAYFLVGACGRYWGKHMPLHVEIIAAEQVIMSEDADVVVAQTASGQVAILPAHAPLVTLLVPGQLRLGRGSTEQVLSVSGGYLEVRENQVVILADAAERVEDSERNRAIGTRERVESERAQKQSNAESARASIALSRAIARIRVAEITRGRAAMRRPN